MARPRSEDKRNAIVAAAIRVVVTRGLSAPTAVIAQEAGVANGSLFTYFPTKADLFNHLYLALKTEMAAAVLESLPTRAGPRKQLAHLWSSWTGWAAANADKRRALAQLGACDEVTAETRAAARQAMIAIGQVLERGRANGPMRGAPMGFVVAIMTAIADATVDFIVQDPTRADQHRKAGFEALWRTIA